MATHIHIHTHDNFEESKHPRESDGKFGSGGGSSGEKPRGRVPEGGLPTHKAGRAEFSKQVEAMKRGEGNGEFGSGGGMPAGSNANEASRRIDAHQSQHAKITGQAMNRQQAAEYVAKGIKPGEHPKSPPLRVQVAEAEKRKAKELAEAKAHPNYHPDDHKNLKEQGYSHEEIMRRWNAEHKEGRTPGPVAGKPWLSNNGKPSKNAGASVPGKPWLTKK